MSKFKDYTDGIDAYEYCVGGMRGGGKTLMQKSLLYEGLLYEELSKELGCPLEVVIKVLEEGIRFEHKGVTLRSNGIHLFYFNNKWIMRVYAFVQGYGTNVYDLELNNYNKTWFLEGEKNDLRTNANIE